MDWSHLLVRACVWSVQQRDGAHEAGASATAAIAFGCAPVRAGPVPRGVPPWQLGRAGADQFLLDRAHKPAPGAGWRAQAQGEAFECWN